MTRQTESTRTDTGQDAAVVVISGPPQEAERLPVLIVDRYGAFVGKHSERLRVSVKGEQIAEAPLVHLDHVLISGGGISISADAIRECADRGISISFVSSSGTPYAQLFSAGLTGTVKTRREQLLAYRDERGAALGRAIAAGKLANQATLLKYFAKYRRVADPTLYEELREAALEIDHLGRKAARLDGPTIDDVRPHLLNVEGRGADLYWEAIGRLLPASLAWPGRQHRGAADPANALLNYGYGILYSQVERAVVLAGLDPYAGFVHVDRAGKPSLVLDLVEEFRQPAVDRTVLAFVSRGVAPAMQDGRLDEATRRGLAEQVLRRLESETIYERKRHRLRAVIQMQARHLAAMLRGERPAYQPYAGRW